MSPHLSRCALTSWRVRHLHPERKSVEDEVTGSYISKPLNTSLSLSLSKQQHTWPWNDWRGLVAVVKPGESSSHWATGPSDGGHMFLCFTLLFIYFYFPQTNPGLKKASYFLDGVQQAQTVTKVMRRKMPPVERMM